MGKELDNQATILLLARTGGLKPHWNSYLGKALRNMTNKHNRSHAPEFVMELKAERPDWFEKSSLRNKKALFQAAEAGKGRYDLDLSLRQAFDDYTNPKHGSWDASFALIMKGKVPTWFDRKNVGRKKKSAHEQI